MPSEAATPLLWRLVKRSGAPSRRSARTCRVCDRPLVVTSGTTLLLPKGRPATEKDVCDPNSAEAGHVPRNPEAAAFSLAERGVRVSVCDFHPGAWRGQPRFCPDPHRHCSRKGCVGIPRRSESLALRASKRYGPSVPIGAGKRENWHTISHGRRLKVPVRAITGVIGRHPVPCSPLAQGSCSPTLLRFSIQDCTTGSLPADSQHLIRQWCSRRWWGATAARGEAHTPGSV